MMVTGKIEKKSQEDPKNRGTVAEPI